MSKPAARVGDLHTCPAVDGVKPHVGGPILPSGKTTVLIGGQPAAKVGDKAQCIGPVDIIVSGSSSVLIDGQPAVRVGDQMAHGGVVSIGYATVLIN